MMDDILKGGKFEAAPTESNQHRGKDKTARARWRRDEYRQNSETLDPESYGKFMFDMLLLLMCNC